jgi:hypothetical protein
MLKYIFISALISFQLIANPLCHFTPGVPRSRIRYITHDKRVVQIINHITETDGVHCTSRCSGFIEQDGIVVTASHCLYGRKKGDKVTIKFIDNVEEEFSVLLVNDISDHSIDKDFAILKGNTRHFPSLPLASLEPTLPLRTVSFGYGMVETQAVLPVIAEYYYKSVSDYSLELTGLVDHGDSGGPVLGFNGTAIGIVVSADFAAPMFSACPYQMVVEAMKKEGLIK